MEAVNPLEAMYHCVRCGQCRDACPTLDITGKEADGPRGRVLMARSLLEGQIPADSEIEQQLDRCLLCSACVDACPIDIPVPDIVMLAKEKIHSERPLGFWNRLFKKIVFQYVLPNQRFLRWGGKLYWFYQKSGLRKLAISLGLHRLLPEQIRQMEEAIQSAAFPFKRKALKVGSSAAKVFSNRTELANELDIQQTADASPVFLFKGCIMDVLFHDTNNNSAELLSRSGFQVKCLSDQVCCGALHLHNGERKTAIELAKRNIAAFERSGAEYLISNAGGCGAMLRDYSHLLQDDPEWFKRAQKFSEKVRDISEIVHQKGTLPKAQGNGERLTYQPSCHLQYIMNVKEAPRQLLRSVSNSEYRELPDSHLCCGSAGIYNLLQPELSNEILDQKMNRVKQVQPQVVLTANPGCLLQLQAGIHRAGMDRQVRAMHVVDYLMECIHRAEQAETEQPSFNQTWMSLKNGNS